MMHYTIQIEMFFMPVVVWVIIAIACELLVARKAQQWNYWLVFGTASLVLTHIYWLVWLTTLTTKDLTPSVDYETERNKLLIRIFFFIMTVFFVPIVVFGVGQVWSQRKSCGSLWSIVRAIPFLGITYIFASTLVHALAFISAIKSSLQ